MFSEDEKSVKFVSCLYEYCDTLVHEPELIDNLYCSVACKKLNSKQMVDTEPIRQEKTEPIVDLIQHEEIINVPKRPVIDRKQLLAKLENRINKRKQLLTSSRSEKMARNNDWDELEQFENSCNEPPSMDEIQSLNSPCRVTTPELDEENGDIIFDLKVYFVYKNLIFNIITIIGFFFSL